MPRAQTDRSNTFPAREPAEPVQSREVRRVTWIGLVVNLALTAFKFAAGIVGHSGAVVADAVHSLSDMFTDAVILVGSRYWDRPADPGHPHGHRRLETLITLLVGATLAAVAVGMVWEAIASLREHDEEPPRRIAFAAAAASIVVKEWLYRWTVAAGHRLRSMPVVANAWHHRSDALSSIPAAAAVAVASLWPPLAYIDHVGVVAVSAIILHAAWRITWPAVQQLMDASAPETEVSAVRASALSTPGVQSIHKVRTRYVGGSQLAVDLHIQVDGRLSVREGHDISTQVRDRVIWQNPGVNDVVVHLEPTEDRAP